MNWLLWKERLLDFFYPPTCAVCGKDGAWICSFCLDTVSFFHKGFGLSPTTPFASLTCVASYANPAWRRMVTTLKYRSAHCLRSGFMKGLQRFREGFCEPWPWAGYSELVIVPAPTDPKRLRARGMDHALLIVEFVQAVFVPWAEIRTPLVRVRSTSPNAQLPTDATRLANVHGVFACQEHLSLPVLLVDDVFTTGATAAEAARVLLDAGASAVHVFTLAKG